MLRSPGTFPAPRGRCVPAEATKEAKWARHLLSMMP